MSKEPTMPAMPRHLQEGDWCWVRFEGLTGPTDWMPARRAGACMETLGWSTPNVLQYGEPIHQADRQAVDFLCGLVGEVSTDDPMTAAERVFDLVQGERAENRREIAHCRSNIEYRDAVHARLRSGIRAIIPQRLGAEAIREQLQALLKGESEPLPITTPLRDSPRKEVAPTASATTQQTPNGSVSSMPSESIKGEK